MLKRLTGEQWIALGVILIGFDYGVATASIPKSTGQGGAWATLFFLRRIGFGLVLTLFYLLKVVLSTS